MPTKEQLAKLEEVVHDAAKVKGLAAISLPAKRASPIYIVRNKTLILADSKPEIEIRFAHFEINLSHSRYEGFQKICSFVVIDFFH